MLDEKQVKYKA